MPVFSLTKNPFHPSIVVLVVSVFQQWIKSWMDLNPEYEYWFWTDDDIEQLVIQNYPQFLPLFNSYPEQIYRVDAFK